MILIQFATSLGWEEGQLREIIGISELPSRIERVLIDD